MSFYPFTVPTTPNLDSVTEDDDIEPIVETEQTITNVASKQFRRWFTVYNYVFFKKFVLRSRGRGTFQIP